MATVVDQNASSSHLLKLRTSKSYSAYDNSPLTRIEALLLLDPASGFYLNRGPCTLGTPPALFDLSPLRPGSQAAAGGAVKLLYLDQRFS
jgi:hypothetical protein